MDISSNKIGEYTASELFENWSDSFSAYEVVINNDGKEDLKILAANKTFANLISADYETLPGRLFTDACSMALEWMPFYIQTAKTGVGNLHESYNQDLKKYLSALVFSPRIGQVAMMVIDRTHLWESDQSQRARTNDLAALFSSMTSGFCVGKIIRDEQGEAVDVLFELVNPAFEILEGFPTATLQGKRMLEARNEITYLSKYIEVVNNRSKITFQKHIELNDFTLEVICFSQSEDMFVCIENNITERIKAEKALQKAYTKIESQNEMIIAGIEYASKIQKNILPKINDFENAFSDYSIIWNPRDIVGGDIYWVKNFDEGTVLCVCDCTGHGTPGALLTMLVVSEFESEVNADNCRDTAEIIWMLEKRLVNVFGLKNEIRDKSDDDIRDGCDLAVLFIAKDGGINLSAGHTNVFVCDGVEVNRIKGQKIYVGEGMINSKDDIKTVHIPHNPANKFYIASDGLFDQPGGKTSAPFGYKKLGDIILKNHNESQPFISDKVWEAFEEHRGSEPRVDDFELITFKL